MIMVFSQEHLSYHSYHSPEAGAVMVTFAEEAKDQGQDFRVPLPLPSRGSYSLYVPTLPRQPQ